MENQNRKLALILLAGLILAAVLGLLADRNNTQPVSSISQIQITEICAKNESIIADNDGNFRDYIEIYNAGSDISLAGFTLTDGEASCSPFGQSVLAAGEYRLIFLSTETTGFTLKSSGGDCLQLKDPSGGIVSQVNVTAMQADQVMALRGSFYRTGYDATPGFSNDDAGLTAFRDGAVSKAPQVLISEILAQNTAACPDEQGCYSDVIELHNISGQVLSLRGFWLSDSAEQRFRFQLPDVTMPEDSYLLVYCDSKNYVAGNGEIHANFSLSAGDVLCLTDKTGSYSIAPVNFPGKDCSMAVNAAGVFETAAPSLGWPNTQEGVYSFAQSRIDENAPLVISEVLLSQAGVPYEDLLQDVVEIVNRSAQPVSTLGWYLTDGGDPYALPEQELAPGEHLMLVCSAATTGFSLSEGETLSLTTPEHRVSSPVTCTLATPGMSITLQADSYTFAAPSPGYANDPQGTEDYAASILPEGLRISEVMTGNYSCLLGPNDVGCDWVEFYNASDVPISLGNYCLSDDPLDPEKYPLPDITLAPGKYRVILLASNPNHLHEDYPWISMSLSSEGEGLYLSCDGTVTDYTVIPALTPNISYGRPGNSSAFSTLASATPGKANSKGAEVSAMPSAVTPQGVYSDIDYLDVELTGEGPIYYTTDCTTPGANATLYTGPIRITKTTVIRAVCRQPGMTQSQTLDLTYLMNEGDGLAAVTLVLEPDDLWSVKRGIYVRGPDTGSAYPYMDANYFQNWERSASVSLFETDGTGFTSPCGVRIFGGYSRMQDVKAFSCFFRDAYGASLLEYPLFGQEGLEAYETFVLRAGGQDVFTTRIRDVLMTSLLGDATDVPVQKYKPVVLYLNGKYWGVYFIREKLNENYVAGNYHVDADTVVLAERNGQTCPEYQELLDYATSHDLSKGEYYAQISQMMDIDEYIDVMVAQMCIGNRDNGNIKFFRYAGGKWTWIFFDTDHGLSNATYRSLREHLDPVGTGWIDDISTELINALMENKEFKDKLLTRLAWQLNNIWTPENINARIDQLEALIAKDIAKDYLRWGYDLSERADNLESLRAVANARRDYMISHVKSYFSLTDAQMRSYGFIP